MPGARFLEGERVVLRTVEEDDLEFLRNAINDPAVRPTIANHAPINAAQEEEFFEEQASGDESVHLVVWSDEERAGTVGLAPVEGVDRASEIGLFLAPDRWNEGLGTEVSRLLVDYAFRELGHHRVQARLVEGNEASRRIWESLGFTREGAQREAVYVDGEFRDHLVYGVLEEEWTAAVPADGTARAAVDPASGPFAPDEG